MTADDRLAKPGGSPIAQLWGPDEISRDKDLLPPGSDPVPYAILGGNGPVQVVMPLETNRVAAGTLARRTNSMRWNERAKRKLASMGLRTGLAQAALRDRFYVTTRSPSASPTLHEYLANLVGSAPLSIAVTFGPVRPNQKPVLKVMNAEGVTIAYAKVGWNSTTSDLVEHEAQFLGAAAGHDAGSITLPGLIHVGPWRDRIVAVAEAVESPRLIRNRAVAVEGFAAVTGLLAEPSTGAWGSSTQLAGARRSIADTQNADTQRLLELVDAAIMSHGDTHLSYGRWHGDWTPWNTGTMVNGHVLWDWERTGPKAPIGFDPIHNSFQPLFARRGLGAAEAMSAALATTAPVLQELGVSGTTVDAIKAAYVVEMMARFTPQAAVDPSAEAIVGRLAAGLKSLIRP